MITPPSPPSFPTPRVTPKETLTMVDFVYETRFIKKLVLRFKRFKKLIEVITRLVRCLVARHVTFNSYFLFYIDFFGLSVLLL